MSFFDIQRTTIYLKVDANAKIVRPLSQKTIGKWVHIIPSCDVIKDNKKISLRYFTMVDADFSKFMKENVDPLWDLLDNDSKFNQKGERVDFPLRPQHVLAVWSYSDNDVKIVKQGNQFYEEMVKYFDQGGDITTCDWACWAEGSGRRGKKYKTSRRDSSPFNCAVPREVLAQKIQAAMDQAISDLRPFKDEAAMLKFISGKSAEEATSFNYGANAPSQFVPPQQQAQPQPQLPAYVPGGPTPMVHGQQPPMQPQMPYPQPQPNMYQPQYQPQPQVQVAPVQAPPPAQMPSYPQQYPQQVQYPQTSAAPQSPYPPSTSAMPQPGYTPVAPQPQTYVPQQMPQQVEVPNAPVTSAPVFAPPAQPMPQQQPQPQAQQAGALPFQGVAPVNAGAGQNPAGFLIDFGKHKGKTLGWIKDNDASYLSFLKGNKKELVPLIDQLMGGGMQVNITPPPPPQAGQPQPVQDNEEQRHKLVKELNQKIMSIPEFQGTGIVERMMPFLRQTIGIEAFSDAPMDKLLILKAAVDQKITARV
jgi:hypothetical protein